MNRIFEIMERCKTVESVEQEIKRLRDEYKKSGCGYDKLTNKLIVNTELLKLINLCHRYRNWIESKGGCVE